MEKIQFEKINPYKPGHLFYMIAPPRAGKSTYCNQWINYQENTDKLLSYWDYGYQPRAIVSQDAIRYSLYGEVYRKEAEPMVFVIADYMAKALLLTGHDVLMDETSTSIETLKRYYRLDKQATPIWLDYDVEVCKARAIANAQEYLIPVIERCHKQYTHLKENWNEIHKELTK